MSDGSGTQFQIEELSPVRVRVAMQVPWPRVERELDDVYAKLQKSAHVKGFRPGKAPRNVIQQMYRSRVHADVANVLLQEGLREAVTSHALSALAIPEVGEPVFIAGQPLSLNAEVEVRPKMPDIEVSDIEIEKPITSLDDSQIASEVESLRQRHAELRVPDPMRPAQSGDALLIDYAISVDGEAQPKLGAQGKWVELGNGKLRKEFEEALIGKLPGDTASLTMALEQGAVDEQYAGKNAAFEITVVELKERLLPQLDDEFAKDLGEYTSLEALRDSIRQRLESESKRSTDAALHRQLIDKLTEKYQVPVPDSMLEQEQRAVIREIATFMYWSGQDPSTSAELKTPEFQDDVRKRAEKRVRFALIAGQILDSEKLTVTHEEVDALIAEMRRARGRTDVHGHGTEEEHTQAESQIAERKVMAYLLSKVKITDAPVAPASNEP